jgi:F0F1-type ATP synthase membrane subunit b/b'
LDEDTKEQLQQTLQAQIAQVQAQIEAIQQQAKSEAAQSTLKTSQQQSANALEESLSETVPKKTGVSSAFDVSV